MMRWCLARSAIVLLSAACAGCSQTSRSADSSSAPMLQGASQSQVSTSTGGAAASCAEPNCQATITMHDGGTAVVLVTLADLCRASTEARPNVPRPDPGCDSSSCGASCSSCAGAGCEASNLHLCSAWKKCVPVLDEASAGAAVQSGNQGAGGAAMGCAAERCVTGQDAGSIELVTAEQLCVETAGSGGPAFVPNPDRGCESGACGESCDSCHEGNACEASDRHACNRWNICVPIRR